MLLNRVLVVVHLVIPVSVAVVHPLLLTITYLLHNPWTIRMLSLVVYTCKKLCHIILCICGILLTRISLPELIHCINRPIASCLIVSACCRLLPSKLTAITNCCLSILVRTALGCNQNHTIGSTRTIDCCSRSVLDYGNRLNVVRIHSVEVTDSAIDNNDRLSTINRGDTTDID